jgi:hypothetical protein
MTLHAQEGGEVMASLDGRGIGRHRHRSNLHIILLRGLQPGLQEEHKRSQHDQTDQAAEHYTNSFQDPHHPMPPLSTRLIKSDGLYLDVG